MVAADQAAIVVVLAAMREKTLTGGKQPAPPELQSPVQLDEGWRRSEIIESFGGRVWQENRNTERVGKEKV